MRRPLLALLAAGLAAPGSATAADSHIQTVRWEADRVVNLTGAIGWQIMIEFGSDERIETVSIGDGLAWQVTPSKRARNLFLKPLVPKAATNMAVVTDRRRYVFALGVAPRRASTPWIVKFDYPRPVVEAIEEPPAPPVPVLNFGYAVAGVQALRPARVWDDGRQTYFEFAQGQPLPAIFAGGPGKDESLVNSVMRGRVAVVQQLGERFTLRAGNQVASVAKSGKGAQ
jgi:type IV secretion system protein VirB9